jgi:hypothetical protein
LLSDADAMNIVRFHCKGLQSPDGKPVVAKA